MKDRFDLVNMPIYPAKDSQPNTKEIIDIPIGRFLTILFPLAVEHLHIRQFCLLSIINYPTAEQRIINRNIHNRPRGGEFMRLGRIEHLSDGGFNIVSSF